MTLAIINYMRLTNEDWGDSLFIFDLDDDGVTQIPVNLTGSTFAAQLRQPSSALHTALEATTANGRLVIATQTGDDVGVLSWNVPKSIMRYMVPGVYDYDMVRTDPDGGVDTIIAGTVTIIRGTTRP